jgi:hypothetical protein
MVSEHVNQALDAFKQYVLDERKALKTVHSNVLRFIPDAIEAFRKADPLDVNAFYVFEKACVDALQHSGRVGTEARDVRKEHHHQMSVLFNGLMQDAECRQFMVEEITHHQYYLNYEGKNIPVSGGHFYLEGDGSLYGDEWCFLSSIQDINAIRTNKRYIHEDEKHLIITSHFLREQIQSNVDKAFNKLVDSVDVVNKGFKEKVSNFRVYAWTRAEGNHLEFKRYQIYRRGSVGDTQEQDQGAKTVMPQKGADFTQLQKAYVGVCQDILNKLESYEYNEAYYNALSSIRSFLRMFDVLYTFCTTGKCEAGIYNQDPSGTHAFFKLPESKAELQAKIKADVEAVREELEKVEKGSGFEL